MSFIDELIKILLNIKRNLSQTFGEDRQSKVPEGLWRSCENCGAILYIPELKKSSYVCSKCGHHFKIDVSERIEVTFDEGSYKSLNLKEDFEDKLNFFDTKKYKDRFIAAAKKSGSDEAISIGCKKLKKKLFVQYLIDFPVAQWGRS